MHPRFASNPDDLPQRAKRQPSGRAVLRYARMAARRKAAELPPATLARLCTGVAAGALNAVTPQQAWRELSVGLMARQPSHMLVVLRACGALKVVLPELDALFGVPQSADDIEVDVGEHQLKLVDETARMLAPLAVRWAALIHKLGKSQSPKEFWPTHYKHEVPGERLIRGACERLQVPDDVLDFAVLVVRECDRVHRAVDMRAAAIATLLQRVQSLEQPERFEHLLTVCTCDYAAYPGHRAADYSKAPRLRRATAAYASVVNESASAEELLLSRAEAIALQLNSELWAAAA
jgi:tRNA nucleotidyltransferase (CCA-adding enzyme)